MNDATNNGAETMNMIDITDMTDAELNALLDAYADRAEAEADAALIAALEADMERAAATIPEAYADADGFAGLRTDADW